MSRRGATHRQLVTAKNGAQDWLFGLPGVTRVGLGPKYVEGRPTQQPAIVVYVDRKLPESELEPSLLIPREIDGIPTDIEIGGAAEMYADDNRYRPLMGGSQITTFPVEVGVDLMGYPGTLGFSARTANAAKTPVVVTCAHVAYWSSAIPDERIGQPSSGTGCSGCCSDIIGRRSGHLYTPLVDGATIDLSPKISALARVADVGAVEPPPASRLVTGDLTPPNPPVNVRIRAASTGVVRNGVVRAVEVEGTANTKLPGWDLPPRKFVKQMDIAPVGAASFSQVGDSGGAILAAAPSGAILGMLWGGDPPTGHGMATQIHDVIAGLGITVATNPPAAPFQAEPEPSASPAVAIARMERELRQTAGGAAFADLVRANTDELSELVSRNRRATIAWHRNSGPAILYHAWRAVDEPGAAIPDAVDGQPLAACVQHILDAFHDEGSPGLRTAIARVEPLLSGLEGGTYGQMLARLDLHQHQARERHADER